MNITIITSIFGAKEVVQECMESWFPLPENWKLIVFNNGISDFDGTSEYVRDQQKIHKFTLLEDGKTYSHPKAMKKLIEAANTDWILHIDSDAKLLNANFYGLVVDMLKDTRFVLFGETHVRGAPSIEKAGKPLYFPRAHNWLLLFSKVFITNHNVTFDDIDISSKINGGAGGIKVVGEKDLLRGDEFKMFGDIGWQVFWEATRYNLYKQFDDDLKNCWLHKNNSSCYWLSENKDKINFVWG